MQHFTTARLAGLVASGCLAMAAIVAPSAALATQPGADAHKVTICHATNSDTNPYVIETVDIASSGSLKAGHNDHTGPVWNADLKAQHIAWGDIIPAYVYGEFVFDGMNLDNGGQEILDNECAIPATDEQSTESTQSETAAETTTDESSTQSSTADETTDETSTSTETSSTETSSDQTSSDEQPTDDGEIAVDDGFVTPTPDSTPVGEVLGATGRPDMTPPATDTISSSNGTASTSGFQAILLVLAGLSTMVLVLGRVPAARRS